MRYDMNVVKQLKLKIEEIPHKAYLCEKKQGVWNTYSYHDVWEKIVKFAFFLQSQGAKEGDHIMIYAANSVDWVVVSYASMMLKMRIVPVYTTLAPKMLQFVVEHSTCTFCFFDTNVFCEKVNFSQTKITSCITANHVSKEFIPKNIQHTSIDTIYQTTICSSMQETIEKAMSHILPSDVIVIIYSSGTSGTPKGIMLTHESILANTNAIKPLFNTLPGFSINQERTLSFLPLSHAYEFTFTNVIAPSLGMTIYFAESLDKIVQNIQEVKPTLMTAVPRLYEMMRHKILTRLHHASFLKKKLFALTQYSGRKK